MEEKKLIRKQIFKLRKECTDSQVEAWSRQIAQKVAELPEFQSAQKILAYADYNHEVMTGFIIEEAWKQGKEVAVPKVVGQDMVFYKLTDFSQLEKGYFGIPEPVRGEIVQWEDAMMVMPGVAFDRANHRVGYGGGFYDRYLEKMPEDCEKAILCRESLMCDEIPTEEHDERMDLVISENGIIRIKKEVCEI